MENEESFHYDEGARGDAQGFVFAGEAGEVILRGFDGVACRELLEMGFEQVELEGGGVVEIGFRRFVVGEVAEVAVVPVLLEQACLVRSEVGEEVAGEPAFSGAAAAGDADEKWFLHVR